MNYINYRLDFGSQVGNSNSEEFPFYTSKNPEGKPPGFLLVHSLMSSLTNPRFRAPCPISSTFARYSRRKINVSFGAAYFSYAAYIFSVFAGFTTNRLINSAIM